MSAQPSPSRSRNGFTLVEILLALTIIGMLVAVAVSKVDGIFGQSQEQIARLFVGDSMKTAMLRYRMDIGDYPSTAEGLKALITAPEERADRWKGPYIESKGGESPRDPWGEPYQYRCPGTRNADGYDLFSKGRDRAADTADDIGNW
ncbi:MAG: type II secretion system major pseudopilin GspG [Opitutales bacterium]|jgi:general secretion pathway protein G